MLTIAVLRLSVHHDHHDLQVPAKPPSDKPTSVKASTTLVRNNLIIIIMIIIIIVMLDYRETANWSRSSKTL